ncbi:unnamed protein product [Boreogadus saida]
MKAQGDVFTETQLWSTLQNPPKIVVPVHFLKIRSIDSFKMEKNKVLCRQKQDLWPGAGLMSRAWRLQQGRGWPSGHSVNHQRLENLLEEGLFTLAQHPTPVYLKQNPS